MPWDLRDAQAMDDELDEALADMSTVMDRAADVVAVAIDENFARESAGDEPWQALADATLEDRRRKGFADGPILERTGKLRRTASAYRDVGTHSAEVGPDDSVDYAKYHASDAPRSRIPLRDFLVVAEPHVEHIDGLLREYLDDHHG